ncbi:hypothetical protein ACFL3B_06315 [Gemmatimonadota bacterium]
MTDQLERLKTALAGRYVIERELGAGGMGTVYLARDLKHHRKVAVNVLRTGLEAGGMIAWQRVGLSCCPMPDQPVMLTPLLSASTASITPCILARTGLKLLRS